MSKKLVIVESPAKARTLARILGKEYTVEASIGHVRDLPGTAAEIPAKHKKEPWARLGVNVDEGFKPLYIVPAAKKDQIKKLKAMLAGAGELYLATDEDREGESISWHLREILKPKVPIHRLVFHEITAEAIHAAVESPREIDEDLVKAQEARRIVDRLYGYSISPLLWKKVKPRLSAGRVQSVAVRLVVERERARIAFHSAAYWDLEARFSKDGGNPFTATLTRVGNRRIATGKDFDPNTGKLKGEGSGEAYVAMSGPLLLDEAAAGQVRDRVMAGDPVVASVDTKPYTERPSPPYTTSTLQQDANRKLRYSARRTMDLAQRLYENGFITYMRTDSTTLSKQAVDAARTLIQNKFGSDYLPEGPRVYKSKVKNAQEAHEAIRPAGHEFTEVETVKNSLGNDAARVYSLIYRRTVACQMTDAHGHRVSVEIGVDDATFQCSGKVVEFPGYQKVYDDLQPKEGESRLPPLAQGDKLKLEDAATKDHRTQPPARLTEASLVKELEARGIGRPSTYASIIETILQRAYVTKQGTALVPSFTAFAVTKLLEDYLSYLVDYGFTAAMEDDLDKISIGEMTSGDYLNRFYNGNGKPGLKDKLAEIETKIDPREVCGIPLGQHEGKLVEVRVGRFGPFVSCGDVRASIPDDIAPDELDLDRALEFLRKAAEGPRVIGNDPETGRPVYAKTGRYGPYVQLGDIEEGQEKPKMASLLAGMDIDTIGLDEALGLLSLPRTLGKHPKTSEDVQAANGRYGPYVLSGKETRSLPEQLSPLTVTLEQAVELLNKPKERRRARTKREPLKVLGEHPETKAEVRILDGRFGPYVTDGEMNASLPRGTTVDEVTLDMGIELLVERAKKGGTKKAKKKKAKKAAKRKTAGKKKSASSKKSKPVAKSKKLAP